MKKVLALMLALCMVFLMAACAGTTKTDSTTAPADNAETNTESTEKKTIAFLPPAMISLCILHQRREAAGRGSGL